MAAYKYKIADLFVQDEPAGPRVADVADSPVPSAVHAMYAQLEAFSHQAAVAQDDDRYPRAVRLMIPLVGSAMLWAMILGAVRII